MDCDLYFCTGGNLLDAFDAAGGVPAVMAVMAEIRNLLKLAALTGRRRINADDLFC